MGLQHKVCANAVYANTGLLAMGSATAMGSAPLWGMRRHGVRKPASTGGQAPGARPVTLIVEATAAGVGADLR